ncbi:MAG: hypothetical protein L0Y54_18815, partial [Sporichthyaceae bacterium]|nr:hypothetical protein [Sporichthyaceae bacterium]
MRTTAPAAVVLALTLVAQLGATAEAASLPSGRKPKLWSPRPLPAQVEVSGRDLTGETRASAAEHKQFSPVAVSWPKAASAVVPLGSGRVTARSHSLPANAAPLPVTVTAAGLSETTGKTQRDAAAADAESLVRVRVASRADAQAAGIRGLLVSLQRADSSAGSRMAVGLDYAGIVDAYGGDYGSRLRLVSLPACALTTPGRSRCRVQTPVVGAVNDTAAREVSGQVVLPAADGGGGLVVLAVESEQEGTAGTFSATSLSPAGSWAHGGNTGAFTYSYPITVPPSVGGPPPGVTLAYSSSGVDGRTSASNNQA